MKITIDTFTKCILGIILFRLFLATDMALFAIPYSPHDDQHFLEQGISLYKGNWLGDYSNMTLIKGPFYPMFLLLNHIVGLPLLLSELLLYILASLLVVVLIRKLTTNNTFSILIFIVLLFNPIVYSDQLTRVIREGVYTAMSMLALFSCMELYYSYLKNKVMSKRWIILSGLSLSGFWLTKEDGIWLLPAIGFMVVCFAFKLYKEQALTKKAFFVLLSPFVILYFFINVICLINHLNYGIYEVVEFNNKEFKDAYGSLIRVKVDTQKVYIPVNVTTREKLYKVIPAFNEIKEGEYIMKGWSQVGPYCKLYPETCGETAGGWFMWSFRDAVALKGHYENAQMAKDYYARLSSEINEACDSKKLDCYPMRSSFLPRMSNNDYLRTIKAFFIGWKDLLLLNDYSSNKGYSIGTQEGFYLVRLFTKNQIKENSLVFGDHFGTRKDKVLKLFRYCYRYLSFPFAIISLVYILFAFFKFIVSRKMPTIRFIFILALLIAINCRMLILAMVETTSFPATNILYMSPIYPLAYVLMGLCLYEVYKLILPFLGHRIRNY